MLDAADLAGSAGVGMGLAELPALRGSALKQEQGGCPGHGGAEGNTARGFAVMGQSKHTVCFGVG